MLPTATDPQPDGFFLQIFKISINPVTTAADSWLSVNCHAHMPLYTGCLCCYCDGHEQHNSVSHCHVSYRGAITFLTVHKLCHHFWAVVSNLSLKNPTAVVTTVLVNVLFRFLCWDHLFSCCLYDYDVAHQRLKNQRFVSNWTPEWDFDAWKAASVTKCIVSHVISAHYIFCILLVYKMHIWY